MAKNIVYCADGTWDSSANNTNPYKLFKACLTSATQVPYYDDGVGRGWRSYREAAGWGVWDWPVSEDQGWVFKDCACVRGWGSVIHFWI